MKKAPSILAGVLLLGAGIALSAAFLLRGAVLTLIKEDVFNGVDTFCVDLPLSRGILSGDVVRAARSAKLDALAGIGLLDENYRLTDLGWEQLDFDDESCMVAGSYELALDGISVKRALRIPASWSWGTVDVSVRAYTDVRRLAAWARSPSVHDKIPEIAGVLRGVQLQIALARKEGRWHAGFARISSSQFRVPQTSKLVLERDEEELLEKYPPPDKTALIQLWLKEHAEWSGAKACVAIAGSGQFPVDEVVVYPIDTRVKRDGFAVAIYEMLERNPQEQKVLALTLPRVELLARAGVLSSSATTGPKFRAQLPGRLYVLAPGQEKYVLAQFGGGCLYAGTTESQVTAVKYRGTAGKLIVRDRYTELAPWATPEVLDGMPDLRKAVEHGVACLTGLNLDVSGWRLGSGSCR